MQTTHSSAETRESEQPSQKIFGLWPTASFLRRAGSDWANAAAYVSLASRMPCAEGLVSLERFYGRTRGMTGADLEELGGRGHGAGRRKGSVGEQRGRVGDEGEGRASRCSGCCEGVGALGAS